MKDNGQANYITLSELQQLLYLPDTATLQLLKSGGCRLALAEDGTLLIDPESLNRDQIFSALITPSESAHLQEVTALEPRILRIFSEFLDEVLHETLEELNSTS